MTRIVVIVLGIVLSGQAFGFEADGYRSGMSLAEVEQRTGKMDQMGDTYFIPTPSGDAAFIFTFCDDKLFAYGANLDGGFREFTRAIERETARLGQGVYSVANDLRESRSKLEIHWKDGDADMDIILYAFSSVPPGEPPAAARLSLSQFWNAYEAVCQPKH